MIHNKKNLKTQKRIIVYDRFFISNLNFITLHIKIKCLVFSEIGSKF